MKTCPHKNLYTSVQSNIFHKSQKVEKPEGPPTEKCLNKMWHICAVEYYLAIKSDKAVAHAIMGEP